MTRPVEEASITHCPVIPMLFAKIVFLDVRHRLHNHTDAVQNDTGNIAPGTEFRLSPFCGYWGIEDGDRKGNGPNPDHLQYPEVEECEKLVPPVVESIVFSSFQDSKEEKSGQSCTPGH